MPHRFQFSLTILILVLMAASMMFGGVYLVSLENKYTSLLHSPALESARLNGELDDSKQKIAILESQVKALQDNLIDMSKTTDSQTKPLSSEVEATLNSPIQVDVYLDPKCFADPDQLDQCIVLGEAKLGDTGHIVVKPAAPISAGTNKINLEFSDKDQLVANYTFETDNLLKTDKPIATVVYIGRNDITLQIKTAPDNKNRIFNYDGQGWIEYVKDITKVENSAPAAQ